MNQIGFKTVDVRLLYWPLSGQAVVAADQQLQRKAMLGVLSEQHSVLQLGIHSSSPSFTLCSLPSYEAGVYLDSSAVELLVVNVTEWFMCLVS